MLERVSNRFPKPHWSPPDMKLGAATNHIAQPANINPFMVPSSITLAMNKMAGSKVSTKASGPRILQIVFITGHD